MSSAPIRAVLNNVVKELSSPGPSSTKSKKGNLQAPLAPKNKSSLKPKNQQKKKLSSEVAQAKVGLPTDAHALLSRVDAGVMYASEYGVDLSFQDLLNVIEAILGQYAMNTGIFSNDNGGAGIIPATNPSSFVLYCLGIAMTWISKVGELGGSNKNDVCQDPSDLELPIALAKYLEHLAPCEEDGAKLVTTFSLDYQIATSQLAYPDAALYPDGTRDTGFPRLEYTSYYLDPNYGESLGFNKNNVTTLPDLWGALARQISQEIKQAGFLTIPFGSVPKRAPNASAYVGWIDPISGNQASLTSDGAEVAACIFKNYNVEEALVFSGQDNRSAPLNPVTKPVPRLARLPATQYAGGTPTYNVPFWFSAAYAFVFVATRQLSYPTGSILGYKGTGLTVAGKRLQSLNISHQAIAPQSILQMIGIVTRNALDNTDQSWTNTEYETFRAVTAIVIYSLVQLRLNYSTPFYYHGNTDSMGVTHNPQSYYIDRDWGAVPVPVIVQRFVDAMGFVLVDGQLVVPFIVPTDDVARGQTRPTNAASLPIGTLRLAVFAGTENVAARILDLGYGTVPANQVPTQIRVNRQLVNYDFLAGFYRVSSDPQGVQLRRCNNFFNGNKAQIQSIWRGLLNSHCSGPTFADSYVQPKNQPHGRCSIMLTQVVVGRNATYWDIFPDDQSANDVYQYGFPCYEVAVVGGLVALPRVCLLDAITQCAAFTVGDDSRLNQGKYSFQVKSGASTDSYITTMNERTFVPNSPIAQAFQASRAAAAKRPLIEVGKSRLPSTAKVDDWATPAVERVMTTIADTIEGVSRFVGHPVASIMGTVLSKTAKLGAAVVTANKLTSWNRVGSSDPNHPDASFVRKLANQLVSPQQVKQLTGQQHMPRAAASPAVRN